MKFNLLIFYKNNLNYGLENKIEKENIECNQAAIRSASGLENPCGNSGTKALGKGLFVPLLPQPQDFGGYNSEKCGIRP